MSAPPCIGVRHERPRRAPVRLPVGAGQRRTDGRLAGRLQDPVDPPLGRHSQAGHPDPRLTQGSVDPGVQERRGVAMRPNGYEYELEIQPTAPTGYEPDTRTRWQKLKDWVLRREYEPTPIYTENTQALFIETTGVNGAVVRHHIPGRCGHCSPDRALRTEGR